MPVGLKAVRPKRLALVDTTRATRDAQRENERYGHALQRELQRYPPQTPTRYRRTGDLGRGWTAPGALRATAREMTLVNRVRRGNRSYGVYVQGPRPGGGRAGTRQTAVMRRKGWSSISDVARRLIKQHKTLMNRAIQGRAT